MPTMLVLSYETLLVFLQACRAGHGLSSSEHSRPLCGAAVGPLPTVGRGSRQLLEERQGVVGEMERLEGERRGIEAEHALFVERKRERRLSRHRRFADAEARRDAGVEREQARIGVLRRRMASEEGGDESLGLLREHLRSCFCAEMGQSLCRSSQHGEADGLKGKKTGRHEIAGCEKRIHRIERELAESKWAISEEGIADDAELAEREARHRMLCAPLDDLPRFYGNRLALLDARMRGLEGAPAAGDAGDEGRG